MKITHTKKWKENQEIVLKILKWLFVLYKTLTSYLLFVERYFCDMDDCIVIAV